MQHRVLSSSDVQIYAAGFIAAHPVTFPLFSDESFVIVRIGEPQVIPARASPLRHGVRLAHRLVGITDPLFCFGKRRFSGAGGFVIVKRWRNDWQFFFLQGAMFAVFPNNRKWFAPVSLTRE
jgi:hypothetical protein